MLVVRSKHKIRSIAAVVVIAAVIWPVMPEDFWLRMSTISFSSNTVREDDKSSLGRLHFWAVAVRMAQANPVLGVGHNAYHAAYNAYDTSNGLYGANRAVHSIWYGLMAELGYPGLGLFILIFIVAVVSTQKTIMEAKRGEIPPELGIYAAAIQTSYAAFIVGATFLSWQYKEMLWHFIGLSIGLRTAAAGAAVPAPIVAAEPARVELQPVPATRAV